MSSFLKLFEKCLNDDYVLVYQMGKVGSKSIENGLDKCIHLHNLYPRVIPARTKMLSSNEYLENIVIYIKKIISSVFIRRAIKSRRTIKIITGIRDPYKWYVSSFFHGLPRWMTLYFDSHYGRFNDCLNDVDVVADAFVQSVPKMGGYSWFDSELKRFTGIDLCDHELNFDKGFCIIRSKKFEVFIYKMECLEEIERDLSSFVGYEVLLGRENVAERKWYECVMNDFKSRYELSKELRSYMYSSKWVKKFYG